MKDELTPRILEHLKIKDIGHTIVLLADYVLRINMYTKDKNEWQLKQAHEDLVQLQKYMNGKKGVICDNVYKVIELGELIQCLEEKKVCPHAKDCWITRKGFAICRKKLATITHRVTKTNKITRRKNAKKTTTTKR